MATKATLIFISKIQQNTVVSYPYLRSLALIINVKRKTSRQ
ncbi:hypothetical protein GXM_02410 [Nostoc sphaeroides CCNUC1]|uniref:Uncharacterized protein n=1 Tax=Nostoc sphaeroides CCNUC1 TaxID=2653204 RepID=A0A5P8VWY9_9NOSO|nr:hypothetical protein GXM_02410 [Nostoc sphaeroides CCNUC1]